MKTEVNNEALKLYLKVNQITPKKKTIWVRFFIILLKIKKLFVKTYYSINTNIEPISDLIERHYKGSDQSNYILYRVKEDFDKICFYNYKKYKNGNNGFRNKHIDLEDFTSECYLFLLDGLKRRNESIKRISINTTQFLSLFIKSRALDILKRRNFDTKDIDSEMIDSVLESEKSAIVGAGEFKTPEELLFDKEYSQLILTALRTLSIKDRTVLEMRFMDGQSPNEISECLDISISKVYDRIKNAKKRLKNEFEKKDIITTIE